MGIIFTSLLTIIFAEALWQVLLTFWDWITNKRDIYMSDKYVTLDEFMNERGEWVKQVVYKVDGDFNGNISGDNVTVILMGDGSINGDVKSKDGEVVLIKGNINGDVKANKILCPCPDDTKKQKRGINIKSYSVILPMYVKHTGCITVPIHLEVTDNGELITIRQIEK